MLLKTRRGTGHLAKCLASIAHNGLQLRLEGRSARFGPRMVVWDRERSRDAPYAILAEV